MRSYCPWFPLPSALRKLAASSVGSVLLETAQRDQTQDESLLFINPLAELCAYEFAQLDSLLHQVDRYIAKGFYVAGYFTYNCGEHFLGLQAASQNTEGSPLAWLGVYDKSIRFDHATGMATTKLDIDIDVAPAAPCSLQINGLSISREEYSAKIARIQSYLSAGDTYQVNFTDKISGSSEDTPADIYAALLQQQPVSYAAYINESDRTILSFSPELFYRVADGDITVRPMKGTWPRGLNNADDAKAAMRLQTDEKNRGEHITIVDLLRNDVGRVSELGSVNVERLMDVERYETLLQMTSTVTGKLQANLSPASVFRQLFPSGSITGAPKKRTMEIIRELETSRRDVYTGSIGYFAPDKTACFNVAIRTLLLDKAGRFSMGVGGGITADSNAENEYDECLLKAAFLTKMKRPFSLIETMLCKDGIALLDRHLERLKNSASYFGIEYDESSLRSSIAAAVQSCPHTECRIRLELNQSGVASITCSQLDNKAWHGRILLVSERTDSTDRFLHHKTTNRDLYKKWSAKVAGSGYDEALFLNNEGYITEGAISNIFFQIDDDWFTPSVKCGLLPGVQRAALLEQLPNVREGNFTIDDLRRASGIFMCNALRGSQQITSVHDANGIIWQSNNH